MTNEQIMADAQTLWDYDQLGHELRPTDIAIGLGSHDIGVAEHTADLYHLGLVPLVVFTGANAPTTVDIFPRGEATHFTERAVELDIPSDAILQETEATNTRENFTFTRKPLDSKGIDARSATVISRPYQQRRAFATARKLWPEMSTSFSFRPQSLKSYTNDIGDSEKVLNILGGDTLRIWTFAQLGYTIPQSINNATIAAYRRPISAGYPERLIVGNKDWTTS